MDKETDSMTDKPDAQPTPKTVEDHLNEWLLQPGTVVSEAERKCIQAVRDFASLGVGYGWMQQVIEWEWQSKGIGSWGPEYFERLLAQRDAELADLRGKIIENDRLFSEQLAAANARVEAMAKGEFICSKCGIRKNSEYEMGDW